MNRDFLMRLTPANARRLLLFRDICNIQLPDLSEIAGQDCIDDRYFDPLICPATPERVRITQFLIDGNWRGIIPLKHNPGFDEIAVINVARHANHGKLAVLTGLRNNWKQAFKAWYLNGSNIFTMDDPFFRTEEWIDQHRACPLILDLDLNSETIIFSLAPLLREFPSILVYHRNSTAWGNIGRHLFPAMVNPLSLTKPNDYALFYNCCIFSNKV